MSGSARFAGPHSTSLILPSAAARSLLPFPSGEKTREGPKRSPFPLADVEAEQNFEFTVLTATSERLDKFLADQLGISRTQAARLVADKRVTVGGKVARASRVLGRGEA